MAGTNDNAKSLMEAIYKRHAVRAYKPDKIEGEVIRTLLRAAVRAPTAIHLEPWAFVVVQDRNLLKRLSDRAKVMASSAAEQAPTAAQPHRDHPNPLADPSFNIFYDAGTLIVICAKPTGPFAVADCWLAAENLMLAAYGLGLGSCPIGFAVAMLNHPEVKAELGIPPEVTPIAPIVVGVPSGEGSPTSRKDPDILSWR
jgi:nitroreductase